MFCLCIHQNTYVVTLYTAKNIHVNRSKPQESGWGLMISVVNILMINTGVLQDNTIGEKSNNTIGEILMEP